MCISCLLIMYKQLIIYYLYTNKIYYIFKNFLLYIYTKIFPHKNNNLLIIYKINKSHLKVLYITYIYTQYIKK